MNNDEQPNSEVTTNFTRNEQGGKSNLSTKRLLGIVGGIVLAIAVAFGGGAALSQFPTSIAQTAPDQTSVVNAQASNTTPTASASPNPVTIPSTNISPAITSGGGIINNDNQPRDNGGLRDGAAPFQRHR